MKNECELLSHALRFAVDATDINDIIIKDLTLLAHHTHARVAGFYWDLNKNFYKYCVSDVDLEIIQLIKQKTLSKMRHFSMESEKRVMINSKLEAFNLIQVACAVVFQGIVLGVIFLVYDDAAFKTLDRKRPVIDVLVHQLALSLSAAECEYRIKQDRYEEINGMISVIESLDEYTRDHCKNTANYALLLAEQLDLPPHIVEHIYYGALFHDMGKIGIPLSILRKESALTHDEYGVIKTHPEKGARILSNFTTFKDIIPIVLHHHEKFDGSGYPDKLKGEDIPYGARLIAVVDAYDALTTNRSYRRARPGQKAIDVIQENTPHQFDPVIVKAFVKLEKSL